jgi:hypothetical protein
MALAHPAAAEDCSIRINAMDVVVDADLFATDAPSRRESLMTWPTRNLTRLVGRVPTCTSDIALNFMSAMEGLQDTDGYCLADGDDDSGLLLVPGARNYRGRCTVSTCERVNAATADVTALTREMAQLAYGAPELDTSSVAHASGAVLLTASRATLQSTLQSGASGALALALSSPPAMAATALTLTAVGGGIYLCAD